MQRIQREAIFEVSLTRSPSRFVGVLRLPRLRTTRFHGGGLPDDRTWREGVLSLKHRRCNETNQYHPTEQSPHKNDRLPGNENVHGRTSWDEERLTITDIILRKAQTFRGHLTPSQLDYCPPCAGGGSPKPHPVAGFGCKVFKYSLGLHETLQTQPGSNLTAARRFNQHMAARNSRCHHTLKRGLEQCSPTLKSVTFSLSISSLRS